MKMRIKDGLPVEETITVDAAHQAEVDALIEAMENEIVTKLNSSSLELNILYYLAQLFTTTMY